MKTDLFTKKIVIIFVAYLLIFLLGMRLAVWINPSLGDSQFQAFVSVATLSIFIRDAVMLLIYKAMASGLKISQSEAYIALLIPSMIGSLVIIVTSILNGDGFNDGLNDTSGGLGVFALGFALWFVVLIVQLIMTITGTIRDKIRLNKTVPKNS